MAEGRSAVPRLKLTKCLASGPPIRSARPSYWSARSSIVDFVAASSTLPTTPELRREEIRLQVALINPLMHVKGYGAPETKAAVERARLLIEQAEAIGEAPEDPLALFSVLYGMWVATNVAFKGDVNCQTRHPVFVAC